MCVLGASVYVPNWLVFCKSLIGARADGAGRWGVIIVLLINLTVGYALKYAARPPILWEKKTNRISHFQ